MSKRVGALWKNNGTKDKQAYLSGELDLGAMGKQRIAVFKNTFKEKDGQPDYHILLSEPLPEGTKNDEVDF